MRDRFGWQIRLLGEQLFLGTVHPPLYLQYNLPSPKTQPDCIDRICICNGCWLEIGFCILFASISKMSTILCVEKASTTHAIGIVEWHSPLTPSLKFDILRFLSLQGWLSQKVNLDWK